MIHSNQESLFAGSRKILVLGTFLVAAFMALSMLGASPARASTTFTVTLPNDVNCLPDGCTLRSAITAANNTPNVGGPDVINFDIRQKKSQGAGQASRPLQERNKEIL